MRENCRVWQYGSTWTLAPNKRKARRNFRAEFGCPIHADDVRRVTGPFEFYNESGGAPWVVSEQEFVERVSTYGQHIVVEGG